MRAIRSRPSYTTCRWIFSLSKSVPRATRHFSDTFDLPTRKATNSATSCARRPSKPGLRRSLPHQGRRQDPALERANSPMIPADRRGNDRLLEYPRQPALQSSLACGPRRERPSIPARSFRGPDGTDLCPCADAKPYAEAAYPHRGSGRHQTEGCPNPILQSSSPPLSPLGRRPQILKPGLCVVAVDRHLRQFITELEHRVILAILESIHGGGVTSELRVTAVSPRRIRVVLGGFDHCLCSFRWFVPELMVVGKIEAAEKVGILLDPGLQGLNSLLAGFFLCQN